MEHKTPRSENLIEPKGNYINGQFVSVLEKAGTLTSLSPADLKDHLGDYHFGYKSVDDAVTVARSAFKSWKKLSINERAQYLNKYKEALKRNESKISETIAREVGKPIWEAKQEVAAMINKVDISLTDGLKLVQDYQYPNVLENTFGSCHFRPHGVFVVLGPFNFPGHLANGHIVPALITGNTVIFKPSEKSPAVGQWLAECFHEAGLPEGVFNLVQGEREVGRRLAVHEGVHGVLFTGSYDVGLKIKQDTMLQYWKLLALEMGGKNASIIESDANLKYAVYETLTSAFITAGQRCSSTSRILVHKSKFDEFIKIFHDTAKAFKIGHPLESPFMGPVIDDAAVDKYTKFLGIASREGCEILMRGKELELEFDGYYVTPSICLVKNNSITAMKKSVYQQSEIFGPNVAVYSYDDLEEAIAITNATQYGLVASIYTSSRDKYLKAAEEIETGLINWNRSTVGASSKLPFGGIKRSGNHFPTAVSASQYCTYPVASLEVAEPKPISNVLPGLNWV